MDTTTKEFSKMTSEQKMELVKKVAGIAQEVGIDLKVELYRETVCVMVGKGQVTDKEVLKVDKELPSTDAEKAKAFNEKVKALTDGMEGIDISVVSKLSAGDMFVEIEDVMPCLHEGHKH